MVNFFWVVIPIKEGGKYISSLIPSISITGSTQKPFRIIFFTLEAS